MSAKQSCEKYIVPTPIPFFGKQRNYYHDGVVFYCVEAVHYSDAVVNHHDVVVIYQP